MGGVKARTEIWMWGGLVALYGLLRARQLTGHFERLDNEELEFGLLPAHLIDGLAAPLFSYQTMWREGGSVLIAPFFAPIFAAIGPSYLALKIAGVTYHGLSMLVWMGIARVALGSRAALLTGLLFACCPPFMSRMQLFGWANHAEGTLFTGLALLLLLVAARRERVSASPAASALLGTVGILCSLSVCFMYTTLPAVVLTLAFVVLVFGFRPRLLVILPGLVIGFCPWIGYLLLEHQPTELQLNGLGDVTQALLTVEGSQLAPTSLSLFSRIAVLMTQHVFWMWGFEAADGSYRHWLNHLVGGMILLLVLTSVSTLWRERRDILSEGRWALTGEEGAQRLLLLFLPLSSVAYLACLAAVPSNWARMDPFVFDGYRYLTPIMPPLLLSAAAGLNLLTCHVKPAQRHLGLIAAVSYCVLALGGQLQMEWSKGAAGFMRHLKGYQLTNIHRELLLASSEHRSRLARSHPADLAEIAVLEGRVAIGATTTCVPSLEYLECPYDGPARSLYYEGVGYGAVMRLGECSSESLHELRTAIEAEVTAESYRALLVGMGRAGESRPGMRPFVESLPPVERSWYVEGWGIQLALRSIMPDYTVLHELHFVEQVLDSYHRGLGMGLARSLLDPAGAPGDPVVPSEWPIADSPDQHALRAGYAEERRRLVPP